MPSMMRRMRTRLPTYLATGLGALVDISNTPWDYASRMKQNENGVCLRRQYRQILLGSVGENCRQLEQRTDWICFSAIGTECEWRNRSVNWRISVCRHSCRQQKENVNMQASGSSLRNAPPNHEKQGGGDNDRDGSVAGVRVNRRRYRGGQAGIQHAFDAETETGDNPAQGIDDR